MRTPLTFLPVLTLALLCSASPQGMADDALKTCLREKVQVTAASVEQTDISSYIKLTLKNTLSWPVSFVIVSYKVTSEGRAVPWAEERFGMSIPGGIEPGETREISTNIYPPSEAPKELTAKAELLDVADAEKRQLIGENKYQGNADDLSPLGCK